MIFDGWTISLNHPTAGTYTASNVFAENLVFTGAREDGQEFIRAELDTTLLFCGADYDYIKGIKDGPDACDDTTITVSTTGYTWEGLLPLNNVEQNDDLKQIQIKPTLNDNYRCLDDILEDEFSIFTGAAIEVGFFQGTVERERISFLDLVDINTPPSPTNDPTDPNWVIYETEAQYNELSELWEGFVTYARQTTVTNCSGGVPVAPGGVGWDLRVNDCGGSGTATYSKEVPLTPSPDEPFIDTATEKSIFFIIPGYDVLDASTISMDNGRLLTQVINTRLSGCGLSLVSDLLDYNGPGTAPSNSVYDQAVNIANLILFQRSDVKNPDATQNATKADFKLEDILNSLGATLDTFWWVNSDDELRIEHISAKSLAEYLDLTTTHPTELKGTNITESDQDDYPRRQQYSWDESYNQRDFEGENILYDNSCAKGSEQFKAEWSTDVNSIYSTDQASNAGFVLVAAVNDGGNYFIPSEPGELSGDELINGHLAWANLHEVYHQHNRPFAAGSVNGTGATFQSTRKYNRQTLEVARISLSTFAALASRLEDPTQDSGIRTTVGLGEVEAYEYDVKNQTINLTLLHD